MEPAVRDIDVDEPQHHIAFGQKADQRHHDVVDAYPDRRLTRIAELRAREKRGAGQKMDEVVHRIDGEKAVWRDDRVRDEAEQSDENESRAEDAGDEQRSDHDILRKVTVPGPCRPCGIGISS